jgi:uncharacterized protein YukE
MVGRLRQWGESTNWGPAVPVTVSQVLGSRPETLVTAAGQLGDGAGDVDDRMATERSRFGELTATWVGTASDAASDHASEMIDDQRRYRDKLAALQRQLAAAGDELGHLRSALSDLTSSIEAKLFHIADDGTTTPGPILKTLARTSPVLAMDIRLRGLALQTAIQTLLDRFDAADQAAAYRLRQIDSGAVR